MSDPYAVSATQIQGRPTQITLFQNLAPIETTVFPEITVVEIQASGVQGPQGPIGVGALGPQGLQGPQGPPGTMTTIDGLTIDGGNF